MTTTLSQRNNNQLLAALAQAMLIQPRATLQELAQAVGISKATLYRFCRTREELEERLVSYGTELISAAIKTAGLETKPPLEALRQLNINCL